MWSLTTSEIEVGVLQHGSKDRSSVAKNSLCTVLIVMFKYISKKKYIQETNIQIKKPKRKKKTNGLLHEVCWFLFKRLFWEKDKDEILLHSPHWWSFNPMRKLEYRYALIYLFILTSLVPEISSSQHSTILY